MYRIYVRQAIEAGIKDSDQGRTLDVKEVRNLGDGTEFWGRGILGTEFWGRILGTFSNFKVYYFLQISPFGFA
jgi:hypothetical protein